jgi:hypothetical protein
LNARIATKKIVGEETGRRRGDSSFRGGSVVSTYGGGHNICTGLGGIMDRREIMIVPPIVIVEDRYDMRGWIRHDACEVI